MQTGEKGDGPLDIEIANEIGDGEGEGNNGIVQHDFSGRASFSLFALLIKYKSVCSGATIGKTREQRQRACKLWEASTRSDPGNLSPLILRNSECDACGCGGDSVRKNMRKTSKNSRVEFGYNSPKPNRCLYLSISLSLCLSVPLSVVLWVLFALCLHFKVVTPTLFPTICLSLSPSCLPSISLVPFCSVFFSTLSLRQIKFKQSHKSWQIPPAYP